MNATCQMHHKTCCGIVNWTKSQQHSADRHPTFPCEEHAAKSHCCKLLQTAAHCRTLPTLPTLPTLRICTLCQITLLQTAANCLTLPHTAHTATHSRTLPTLQIARSHCRTLLHTLRICTLPNHTAANCCTLLQTAAHCPHCEFARCQILITVAGYGERQDMYRTIVRNGALGIDSFAQHCT
jgi:hypothetical protein